MDDQRCPGCGISKAGWTVKLDKTRMFVLSKRTDKQDDQVLVLKQAAQDGTPFCEKCEKARKKREAARKPPPPPSDPAGQVTALKQAAETGAPFCEKCERAKQELEAQAAGSGTSGGA